MADIKVDPKQLKKLDPKKLKNTKIDAKQLKGSATKAGAPPAPRIQSPDQIKKQAKERAKARMKMMLKLLVFMVTIALVGLIVYFVKFYGRQPKDALSHAINYAYDDNVIKFKQSFTTDSIVMVEGGNDTDPEPWKKLMDSITPTGERTKVLSQKIEEKNQQKLAEVKIKLDGEERSVYMREEEGKWKINLNVSIDPRHITLPDDIPADYIDNFNLSDEPEAWWEIPPEETEKKGGFLSKFKCSGKKFF